MDEDTVRKEFEAWYLITPLVDDRWQSEIAWDAYRAGRSAMAKESAQYVDEIAETPDQLKEWLALAEKENV